MYGNLKSRCTETMPELLINQRILHWRHEVKKCLRHSYILVRPEGVTLRSPPMSQAEAEALLRRKSAWIFAKLDLIQSSSSQPVLESGRPILLLGQNYTLQIHSVPDQSLIRVWQEDQQLILQLPERCRDYESIREEALHQYLRQQAIAWMGPRLQSWAETLQLLPRQVRYKRHRCRWGSCTVRNEINLNYRAIQLPPRCIDSILVHELAHIRHKNHGPHFWELVYTHIPDYRQLDQQIKTLAPQLF